MALYEMLPEHEARLAEWAAWWTAHALRTDALDEHGRACARAAVAGLYDAAGLSRPHAVVVAPGAVSAARAAGYAAGIWWLREHPERHVEIAGRALTEVDYALAVAALCGVESRAATWAATDAATLAATDAATRAATLAATLAATDAATWAATEAFLARCAQYSYRIRSGGGEWSGAAAFYSFFRHVARLPLDYSRWEHYESAALHGGSRWMHSRFTIVADRPEYYRIDDEHRLHCADGPARRDRDGYEHWYWHGVSVPREWIMSPSSVDPSLALTWTQVEQRHALCEIIGWGAVLSALAPAVVDEDADPMVGTLLRADLPEFPAQQFLRARCGTGRDIVLRVPPDVQTALEANAWTYGVEPATLRTSEGRS